MTVNKKTFAEPKTAGINKKYTATIKTSNGLQAYPDKFTIIGKIILIFLPI